MKTQTLMMLTISTLIVTIIAGGLFVFCDEQRTVDGYKYLIDGGHFKAACIYTKFASWIRPRSYLMRYLKDEASWIYEMSNMTCINNSVSNNSDLSIDNIQEEWHQFNDPRQPANGDLHQ